MILHIFIFLAYIILIMKMCDFVMHKSSNVKYFMNRSILQFFILVKSSIFYFYVLRIEYNNSNTWSIINFHTMISICNEGFWDILKAYIYMQVRCRNSRLYVLLWNFYFILALFWNYQILCFGVNFYYILKVKSCNF